LKCGGLRIETMRRRVSGVVSAGFGTVRIQCALFSEKRLPVVLAVCIPSGMGFEGRVMANWPTAHPCPSNNGVVMPKMKTKKSAAKRFVVRPGGTVKRGQAFKRHILTKKTTKNKRHLRGSTAVHDSDLNSVRAMLPFA
jgi:large subunit ribosomal protein L35